MTIEEQIQWLERKLDDCSASEGDAVDEIIKSLKLLKLIARINGDGTWTASVDMTTRNVG